MIKIINRLKKNILSEDINKFYVASTLRAAAVNLVAGFSSVYLYKQGYSIIFIMLFSATHFLAKLVLTPLAGLIISRSSVVTGILISNILYIPALISLSLVPLLGFPAIALYGLFLSLSLALYNPCYLIIFSKIKNEQHAGRQIGFMKMLGDIVSVISPLVGGIIALLAYAQASMWLACFILILAGLPLIKIGNKLKERVGPIKYFPWRLAMNSLVAQGAIGFSSFSSADPWALFISIFILPAAGSSIYAALGAFGSATVIISIISALIFGRLIDSGGGGRILKLGVIASSIINLFRPLVSTAIGLIGINISKDLANNAQAMTFTRGVFDIADSSKNRIIYISLMEMSRDFGLMLSSLVMVICLMMIDGKSGFQAFYIITALIGPVALISRFKLYKK